MTGPRRGPDYKVMVAVPINPDETKFKYYQIGSAWANENDWFNLTIMTMPNVRLRMVPIDYEPNSNKDPYA